MNKMQKIILIVYTIAFLFLSAVHVPYTATRKETPLCLQYYSSIWSPRNHPVIKKSDAWRRKEGRAGVWLVKINTSFWFVEILTLSVVCAILFIISRKSSHAPPLP